ncbi:MAG: hypothetical protein ACI8RZ_000824 [Myxococcota bacterium]|jgi:hypothetical protein
MRLTPVILLCLGGATLLACGDKDGTEPDTTPPMTPETR